MNGQDRDLFIRTIREYYASNRRSFPWRDTRDPYAIFVSEIMLQQTQTARVTEKWTRFIERFPSWEALADASTEDLYQAWKGLGYNRRALYLRESARIIMERFGGAVPDDPAVLLTLPGIGAATAGSLCAFIHDKPVPFIETNIRRVFIHFFFPESDTVDDSLILPLVAETMDNESPREWFNALMDYGVFLTKGGPNPNRRSARYIRQGRFEGSSRFIRGRILSFLLERGGTDLKTLKEAFIDYGEMIDKPLSDLEREGFVAEKDGLYRIEGSA